MKSANISESLASEIYNGSTIKHTTISNIENGRCKTSEFIVFGTDGIFDWFGIKKFNEFNSLLDYDSSLDYPLKKTVKGNEDEGIVAISGKAIYGEMKDSEVTIKVYTQVHGKEWEYSHTHIIDVKTYLAYVTVFENTELVIKAEKENHAPINFSMNLDKKVS